MDMLVRGMEGVSDNSCPRSLDFLSRAIRLFSMAMLCAGIGTVRCGGLRCNIGDDGVLTEDG